MPRLTSNVAFITESDSRAGHAVGPRQGQGGGGEDLGTTPMTQQQPWVGVAEDIPSPRGPAEESRTGCLKDSAPRSIQRELAPPRSARR